MIEWARQVPDSFRFAIKFPRSISHSRGLEPDQGRLEAFLSRIQLLEDKAGPLLIQFPSTLKPDKMSELAEFLNKLPLVNSYAIEFRQKDWFNEGTYKLLRDNNVALVTVEHPVRPTIEVQTAEFSYIRLEGDRTIVKGESGKVEQNKSEANRKWVEKISELSTHHEVYCYISKHYSGYPPVDLEQIMEGLKST